MNSVAPTVTIVKAATTGANSYAFDCGVQDAINGLTCCPEMYVIHRLDQRDYASGYASIRGHNDTTLYFLGGNN